MLPSQRRQEREASRFPFPGLGVEGGQSIAIAPDGQYAYVVEADYGTVTPVNLRTDTAAAPVTVFKPNITPSVSNDIAIAPDGKTAYVASEKYAIVTPIDLTTQTRGRPITPGLPINANHGLGLAITPDGKTLYVASFDDRSVIPIDLTTNKPEAPIRFLGVPGTIAVTPDGKTLYVTVLGTLAGVKPPYPGFVVPIATASNTVGSPIKVGLEPTAIAITPDGKTAYVANSSVTGRTALVLRER